MNRCIRKGCVDFLKSEEGGKEESKVGREERGKESNKTGGNAGQAWVPEKKRKHLHPSWYLPVTTLPTWRTMCCTQMYSQGSAFSEIVMPRKEGSAD